MIEDITWAIDGYKQDDNEKLRNENDLGHFSWFFLWWKKVMDATISVNGHSKSSNDHLIWKYDQSCPIEVAAAISKDFVHWDLDGYWWNSHDRYHQLETKLKNLQVTINFKI